jgi:hypothetical protein
VASLLSGAVVGFGVLDASTAWLAVDVIRTVTGAFGEAVAVVTASCADDGWLFCTPLADGELDTSPPVVLPSRAAKPRSLATIRRGRWPLTRQAQARRGMRRLMKGEVRMASSRLEISLPPRSSLVVIPGKQQSRVE